MIRPATVADAGEIAPQRAAGLGVEVALTANHDVNAPMLPVNEKLGYGPLASSVEWERHAK